MLNTSRIDSNKARPNCCWVKKRILHPTLITAFKTNSPMIKLKFRSFEYLFHIIRIEIEVKTNMIIQMFSINILENVHPGSLIDLYQAKPVSAK